MNKLQSELPAETTGRVSNELEGFMKERMKFEHEAQSFFNDIFSKLEGLNQMLSQVCLTGSVQFEPCKDRPQFIESISKERERLENLVSQKIDQIFTARLRDMGQSVQNISKATSSYASHIVTLF